MPIGCILYFEEVPLVEFLYTVFTGLLGGVSVGDSGLCCCVPCLLSAINNSLGLLILSKTRNIFPISTLPSDEQKAAQFMEKIKIQISSWPRKHLNVKEEAITTAPIRTLRNQSNVPCLVRTATWWTNTRPLPIPPRSALIRS